MKSKCKLCSLEGTSLVDIYIQNKPIQYHQNCLLELLEDIKRIPLAAGILPAANGVCTVFEYDVINYTNINMPIKYTIGYLNNHSNMDELKNIQTKVIPKKILMDLLQIDDTASGWDKAVETHGIVKPIQIFHSIIPKSNYNTP